MSAKNYNDHIALLKSREARPSFERTRAIIESRDTEPVAYVARIGQPRNLAIGIAALVLLALFARMAINDSPKTNLATKAASATTNVIPSSQAIARSEHSTLRTSLRGVPERRRSNLLRASAISIDRPRSAERFVTPSSHSAMTQMTNTEYKSSKDISATEESTLVQLVTSVSPRPIIIENVAHNDLPLPLSQIANPDTNDISANRFFVTASGGFSQELNSIASNNRSSFDAFLGVGYIISSHLSIGLAGGRETFVMKQPYYSMYFTNEPFVHDSVSYPSLIGHIDTGSTPQSTQIYSIGANLRYTFIENSLSPYAEIFGGGSNVGAIAGATIGLSIFHFDMLSIDAGAFIRSLFSPTSSPLTKLGASLDLRYDL